ncbi:MAG: type IX secretion system periplasmic lipoprotein PorW/SprE [Bacteroidia bacterium]
MRKIRPYQIVFLALTGLFLFSCTQYKNKFINRGYHNMTARYNVYFYAKEALKDGVFKVETGNKDDYNKLLPVFIYATKESAKNVSQEMDRAIKKASLCIQKHAIKDKQTKVEIPNTGRWIDDSWNTIGKAHFYKREFFSGIEAFEYVQSVYKSKQKYEAWLWEMKTYNELNSLTQSLTYINLIKNDKKFPAEYKGHFEALYAEFYIKQGSYEEAIKHLLLAIKYTKERSYVARYHFILGQLNEMKDDAVKARMHYHLCIKNKPIYDMVFYAKMKESLLYKDPASIEKAKKNLQKMLKDIKNDDFKDVIYYTLGQMEEKENNPDKAYEYYKLSAKNSTSANIQQKAKSYLKLADLSFDRENYTDAAGYYDSTVSIIKDDFPNYQDIVSKKKSLNTLVKYVTTIKTEDSLQRLANMDTSARNKYIRGMIQKLKEDEKRAAEAKQNQSSGTPLTPNNTFTPNQPSTGTGQWYFYNTMLKAQGLNDYVKRWGNTRKNEDNWRRSNKAVNFDQLTDNPEKKDSVKADVKDSAVAKSSDPHQVEYYTKTLPLLKSDVDSSNKRILEAYYALGSLYREQLNNPRKSAETFETMNKRFPKNPYEAPSYYQMYRIYLVAKDDPKAAHAKEFLLSNYPTSDYAKIINDPDFAKSAAAKKNEIETYYGETYDLFLQKNYLETIERSRVGIVKFGKNDYTAKFAYLNALAKGYQYGVDSLEQALRVVTIKFDKSEVYAQAKDMLNAIKRQRNEAVAPDSTKAPAEKGDAYLYNADALHDVIVVINNTVNIDAVKILLSDFNGQFFSLSNLKLLPPVPKGDKFILCVKQFLNKDEAMGYHDLLVSKPNLFRDKGVERKDYEIYAISEENIGSLLKKDNFDDYKVFFNAKYLGIKQ